jgi:putative tryptophan/tyrosine transport system permease protein
MNLLLGALTMGFILTPLALGTFLAFRVYHTIDLTTDGSFGLGAAVVAALLVRGAGPVAAVAVAIAAGVAAGIVTGLLHTQLQVSTLLAGVLTSTALYSGILFIMGSGSLSLAATGSFLAWFERVAQGVLGLPAELTLAGTAVPGARLADLVVCALTAAVLILGLTAFLKTDLGLAMRATGNNPQMARALGIEVDRMLVCGLGLSNGLIALSGALFAQYQGFASIEMGIGAVVMGLAMLMVGERLVGTRPLGRWIVSAAAGALIFRLVLALAVRAGLNPNALKFVTALFVLAVLVLPALVQRTRRATGRRVPHRA